MMPWLTTMMLVTALDGAPVAPAEDDADALYARRQELDSAEAAARVWAARVARDPKDFEAAWKLARARYWLGRHLGEERRAQELEEGVAAARLAVAAQPVRPEGHFWLAANMGRLGETQGLLAGLKYRNAVKEELEEVLRIDPAFDRGAADRALGRWYARVPPFLGGDRRKGEEHLRRALVHGPGNVATRFFLAELLLEDGRADEARAEFEAVRDGALDRDWAPEGREIKLEAQRRLEKMAQR
jgi:hypothetical protein